MMHYYQFNIGDYRKDTVHLSRLEHGIYRDLIDWYYLEETPIPKETQVVIRRLRLDSEMDVLALNNVLSDFFSSLDDGFHHARIDAEITDYRNQCEKNKVNGKLGGRPRGKKTQVVSTGLRVVSQVGSEINPNQEPLTTNQLIHTSADKLPTCPTQEIIDLYNKILPELPAVRIVNDKRKRDAKKFWHFVLTSEKSDGTPRASTAEQALEWIGSYFLRAKDNDFVMGRIHKSGEHANWIGDFDYLMTDKGITQVIEKTREAA